MTKPLLVKKYGGAVLSTPEKIKAIAASLKKESEKYQLIVAVSAMGSTTNDLLKLAHAVAAIPNRRELDLLLTVGERISMSLLSIALNDLGCPSVSFTGSQAGIITEDLHGEAQIVEIKPIRVEEALAHGKIVIIAGYQGVSKSTKDVTTLGRGGTDITAVALAAHFKALRCEILKDVPGVMTADPQKIPQTSPLTEVGYDEFAEMTYWGAKVLNYRAANLAREKRVPLWIGPVGDTSQVTCIGEKSMTAAQRFSVNTWQDVLMVEVAAASVAEVEKRFREVEKQFSLTPLHVLHQEEKSGQILMYVTGPKESIEEWEMAFSKRPTGMQLQKKISSLTHTGAFLEQSEKFLNSKGCVLLSVKTPLSRHYFMACENLQPTIAELHQHLRTQSA